MPDLYPAPRPLTAREREVVGLLAEGMTYAEIGARLFITADTVKTHVTRDRRAIGARNKVHLVVLAGRTRQIRLVEEVSTNG